MIGIILALALGIGGAFGLWKVGEGFSKAEENISEALGKSITWLTIIAGVVIVLLITLFFMTRSKATLGAGPVQAAVIGGGKVGGG